MFCYVVADVIAPASLSVPNTWGAANGPMGVRLAPIGSNECGGMIGPAGWCPKAACIGGGIIGGGIISWECARLGDQLEGWLWAIHCCC